MDEIMLMGWIGISSLHLERIVPRRGISILVSISSAHHFMSSPLSNMKSRSTMGRLRPRRLPKQQLQQHHHSRWLGTLVSLVSTPYFSNANSMDVFTIYLQYSLRRILQQQRSRNSSVLGKETDLCGGDKQYSERL